MREELTGRFKTKYPPPEIGAIFGNWTVIAGAEKNENNNHKKCLCRCKCGTERPVNTKDLITGHSTGCRCENIGRRLRPYEALYKLLLRQAAQRNYAVELTYEQFYDISKQERCHYCNRKLTWAAYNIIKKKSCRHNIDRKDNAIGYTRDNCVACCAICNAGKMDQFTYEQWKSIGQHMQNNPVLFPEK